MIDIGIWEWSAAAMNKNVPIVMKSNAKVSRVQISDKL